MRGGIIAAMIFFMGCGGLAQRELDDLEFESYEDASPQDEETLAISRHVDGGGERDAESNGPVERDSDIDDVRLENGGWTRTFGGDEQDWPREVAATHDGSVIVSGTFAGTVDFDPGSGEQLRTSEGDRDLFVVMLNRDGDFQWVQTIGLGPTLDVGVSMVVGSEGEIVLAGQYAGTVDFDPHPIDEALRTSAGEHDLFILSLDRSGGYRWVQTLGGSGDESATDVSVTLDGELLVAGQCSGIVDLDPSSVGENLLGSPEKLASFVLKLSIHDGALLWWTTLAYGLDGRVNSLVPLEGGEIVCSGRFEESIEFIDHETGEWEIHEAVGERDVFVLYLDENGAIEWIRTFGQSGEDWATSAIVTDDGTILITGHFEHGFNFGPDLMDDHEAMGCWDAFILALDLDGELLWSRAIGGMEWDWGAGIVLSSAEVLVVGSFSKAVNFDPSGSQRRDSQGMWDFFLLSLDLDGEYRWARTWGGRGRDYAEQMAVAPDGSIYLIGNFQGRVNFSPCGTTNDVHTAQGGSDAFVTRLLSNGCYQ